MADKPEIAPETGTGTEEIAETVEVPEEPTAPDADASAVGGPEEDHDDDGESHAASKTSVPYDRFRAINERRKAAESKAAELQAKLSALETPKAEQPKTVETRSKLKSNLKSAPADLTALQQMEFYGLETMEEHLPALLDAWFEKKFGMASNQAAATMQHATISTRQRIVSEFNEAAKTHGLDPKSETLRSAVGALMDTGKFQSFADAMDAFKPATVPKPPVKMVNGKGAEIDSVDLTGLSRVRAFPKNAQEAMALAAAGKKVEPVSVTDILRASMAKS